MWLLLATPRENTFRIMARAVHICRRNVAWFHLYDLRERAIACIVRWRIGGGGGEWNPSDDSSSVTERNWWIMGLFFFSFFFAWRRVVQLHKVNFWVGSFRLKRGSLEKQAGSKTKSKQMQMNGRPIRLCGRARRRGGVAREKCCLTFSTVDKVYSHANWNDGVKLIFKELKEEDWK